VLTTVVVLIAQAAPACWTPLIQLRVASWNISNGDQT